MQPMTQRLIDHVSGKIAYSNVTEKKLPGDQIAVTFVMENRQSGKTFRNIMRALFELSDGRDVVYVLPDRYTSTEILHRAARICEAAHLSVDVRYDRLLLQENGKSLRFMSIDRYEDDTWYRGLDRDMAVIFDGVGRPVCHPEPPIGRML